MPVTGTPVFNSLKIVTIDVNFHEGTMDARAAFVNTSNGETYGWTDGKGLQWSQETKDKAAELARLMELDLAKRHFGEAATSSSEPTGLKVTKGGGLSEHVVGDADSV
jgi:hypothetical protein